MTDPKVNHGLPVRYWDRFRLFRTHTTDGLWYYLWECRLCGQRLKPNTAGAQSHIAKHLRIAAGHPREDGQ
jgi:hypothetical protein